MLNKLYSTIIDKSKSYSPKIKRQMRTLYQKCLLDNSKDAIPRAFREQFPREYSGISYIHKVISEQPKARATAKLIYLFAFGKYPKCHICGCDITGGDRPGSKITMCSEQCSNTYMRQCAKKKMIKKHGVSNIFSSEHFNKNRTKYLTDKYGEHVTGPTRVPGAQEKIKQTSITRYGVDNFAQSSVVKNKRIKTIQKTYGKQYTSSLQLPVTREAFQKYAQDKFGVSHISKSPEIKQKKINTSLERYGVTHPAMLETTKLKAQATSIKNYGVPYPMQNAEEFEKSKRYRTYEGTWRGHKIHYQGYEMKVLKTLESKKRVVGISVSRSKVGTVGYIGLDGKQHVYFPDFKVKLKNKIKVVEVKSLGTLGYNTDIYDKKMLSTNLLKFKAAYKMYAKENQEFWLAILIKNEVCWIPKPHINLISKVRKHVVRLS